MENEIEGLLDVTPLTRDLARHIVEKAFKEEAENRRTVIAKTFPGRWRWMASVGTKTRSGKVLFSGQSTGRMGYSRAGSGAPEDCELFGP